MWRDRAGAQVEPAEDQALVLGVQRLQAPGGVEDHRVPLDQRAGGAGPGQPVALPLAAAPPRPAARRPGRRPGRRGAARRRSRSAARPRTRRAPRLRYPVRAGGERRWPGDCGRYGRVAPATVCSRQHRVRVLLRFAAPGPPTVVADIRSAGGFHHEHHRVAPRSADGVRRASLQLVPAARSTCSPSTSATGSAGTARWPRAGRRPRRAGGPGRRVASLRPGVAASSRRPPAYLTVDRDGRFELPGGPAEVLTDADSLSYLAPLARMLGAAAIAAAGPAARLPRGWRRQLGRVRPRHARVAGRHEPAHLPAPVGRRAGQACPRSHEVLRRPRAPGSPTSAAAAGWSSVALATAYPRVLGRRLGRRRAVDRSGPGQRRGARRRPTGSRSPRPTPPSLRRRGLRRALRVRVRPRHAATRSQVLTGMRRAVKPDGVVVVMDEAVGGRVRRAGRRRRPD